MTDKGRPAPPVDDRPQYEPPTAIRMGERQTGMGLCQTHGSGDTETCINNGFTAVGTGGYSAGCFQNGSNASRGGAVVTGCYDDGLTAVGGGDSDGNFPS